MEAVRLLRSILHDMPPPPWLLAGSVGTPPVSTVGSYASKYTQRWCSRIKHGLYEVLCALVLRQNVRFASSGGLGRQTAHSTQTSRVYGVP